MAVDYRRNVRSSFAVLGERDEGVTRHDLLLHVWALMRGEADLEQLLDAVNAFFVSAARGRDAKRRARAQSLRMPA